MCSYNLQVNRLISNPDSISFIKSKLTAQRHLFVYQGILNELPLMMENTHIMKAFTETSATSLVFIFF